MPKLGLSLSYHVAISAWKMVLLKLKNASLDFFLSVNAMVVLFVCNFSYKEKS